MKNIIEQILFGFFASFLRMILQKQGSMQEWLRVFERIVDLVLAWVVDCDTPMLRTAFIEVLEKSTADLVDPLGSLVAVSEERLHSVVRVVDEGGVYMKSPNYRGDDLHQQVIKSSAE